VLAELQNSRHQRSLTEAVVELCRERPERLAPWLADPRWPVVRNVVQMLAAIGGNAIAGMLQSVARHPEPRVRLEVVAALRRVDHPLARPILLRLLEDADARMFCSVVPVLCQTRDIGTAELLLGYLMDPEFEKRSPEEKRAIYSGLSTAGGDDVLPSLEEELHKGSWFSRTLEPHRQAVARCVARIGTPAARLVLERAALSRRTPVRKAAEEALARMNQHD
jgi:HEAT repeat protein